MTSGKVETGVPGGKYAYGFGEEFLTVAKSSATTAEGPGIGSNFDIFPELDYTAVIPSAVAPDPKSNFSNECLCLPKIITKADPSIRRYRARFCNAHQLPYSDLLLPRNRAHLVSLE